MRKKQHKTDDDESHTVSPMAILSVISIIDTLIEGGKAIINRFKNGKQQQINNQEIKDFILNQNDLNSIFKETITLQLKAHLKLKQIIYFQSAAIVILLFLILLHIFKVI